MKKLEMYHASYDSFENFDEKFITLSETDTFVNGFWFSSEKTTSCAWRNPRFLKKCVITLSNPIEYREMKKIYVEEYQEKITCDDLRREMLNRGYDGVVFSEPIDITMEKIVEGTVFETLKGSRRKFIIGEFGGIEEYTVDKWGNEEYLADYIDIEDYRKTVETVVICFNASPIEILWEKNNPYWG